VERGLLERGLLAYGPMALALLGAFLMQAYGMAFQVHQLWIMLATPVPLYLASRAWRLPWWLQAGAASLPLSVLIVALVHADAAGATRATKFAATILLLLGTISWARTSRRRMVIAAAIGGLGVLQLMLSLPAWFSSTIPPLVLRGAVGWHNQLAGLEVVSLAVGLGLLVLARGWFAVAGAVATVVAATAVLISGSRFGLALAAVAVLAALLLGARLARAERRLEPLLSPLVATAVGFLLALLLRSPLVFPSSDGSAPTLGAADRGDGADSFGARLDFWRAALGIGAEHPLAGVGLLSFDDYAACYELGYMSWQPHNEWMYAWAAGGVIMLAPMILILVALVALLVKSLRRLPSAADLRGDPGRWGGLVGISLAVAHQALEYDLWYPAILVLFALTGGIAAAPWTSRGSDRAGLRYAATGLVALAVIGGAAGLVLDPAAGTSPWEVQGEYDPCPVAGS